MIALVAVIIILVIVGLTVYFGVMEDRGNDKGKK
jgi:hypothetical protein